MDKTVRIRVGNQTAHSARDMTEPFEYALNRGFDAFEWFPDKKESGAGWKVGEVSIDSRRLLRQRARSHDMEFYFHAPLDVNLLGPEGEEALIQHVQFAQEIGASLFTIHPFVDGGTEVFLRALRPLMRRLDRFNMGLSIENTPDTGPGIFNDLFRKLRSTDWTEECRVGMCLDVGHANLCSATRNDYLAYVDSLDRLVPIIHLHLHENYGDSDTHLPIFTGPAGVDPFAVQALLERLKERHFSGAIILEQWPEPPSLLDNARERLLDMLSGSAS